MSPFLLPQGRAKQVATGGATYDYEYNDSGLRISETVNSDAKTIYVLDAQNHTGYSQILEEKNGSGAVTKSYQIGLDVIAQATSPSVAHYFINDGHGSTRALLDNSATANVVLNTGTPMPTPQLFTYDAYGNLVHLTGQVIAVDQSLTSHMYSGEQTDMDGRQNLRDRIYEARTGRFDRTDRFAGIVQRPLSLHKYLYTHGDPVNMIDPTGKWSSLGDWWRTFKTDVLGTLYYLPGAYWDTAVNGEQMRSLAAWADGVIPFYDPFDGTYENDNLHQWSRLMGRVSRDAFLAALIPNIGTWVESPFFYELGATTVPRSVWAVLEEMTVIQRGHYLWETYGFSGFFWATLQFMKTAPTTGLTPGGWLGVVGIIDVFDAYQDTITSYIATLFDDN